MIAGGAVGLSASAASRRIQAQETMGAIRGYRALIDDRLLGKHMTVFVRVTLERQSAPVLAGFEAAVRHTRGIVSCHLMAGQYDYMLVARVADIDDYKRPHENDYRGCRVWCGWRLASRCGMCSAGWEHDNFT